MVVVGCGGVKRNEIMLIKIKKYIYTESVLKCFLFISLFADFNCDTSSEVDSIPNSHGHRLAHNMSSHDLISVAGSGCSGKCCAG